MDNNAKNGWIKLYRSLLNHWVFEDAITVKAWIYILLQANHEDKKTQFNGNLVTIERGQFITSIRKLSEAFGCSRKKTLRIINDLETDGMIVTQRVGKGTYLTVLNYKAHQDFGGQKRASKVTSKVTTEVTNECTNEVTSEYTSECTTEVTTEAHKQEDKNYKELKKTKNELRTSKKEAPPTLSVWGVPFD